MPSAIQTNDLPAAFNHRIEAVVDTLPFDSHATALDTSEEAQRRKLRQKQIDQNRSIRKLRHQEYNVVSLRQNQEATTSTNISAAP